jgi:hypothetical protein
MSAPATAFVTFLWHYVAARLIYDDLVRPLTRGQIPSALVLVAIAAGVAFAVGRRRGRGV